MAAMRLSPFEKRRDASVLHSSSFRKYPSHQSSSTSSAFASSTSYSFSSPQPSFFVNNHHRSASPTRVNLCTTPSPSSQSFKFSINRPISPTPNRSISVSKSATHGHHTSQGSFPKKTCMCSPTSHPGSFRCSLHKHSKSTQPMPYTPNRLNMMRSAMKNSLVRIGGVEGEWVKRALTALIRPSSHQQRRRVGFCPRPSRLCVMQCAGD